MVTMRRQRRRRRDCAGCDALCFVLHREQAIAALVFNDMEQTMDVNAVTSGGGTSGQAGALRYAIAQALCTFVDAPARERMRLAGLLTRDPRLPERKKPGKKKARKGFTWYELLSLFQRFCSRMFPCLAMFPWLSFYLKGRFSFKAEPYCSNIPIVYPGHFNQTRDGFI